MPRPAAPSIWRAALVRLAAVEVALLLMFASDVADLVRVWTADATYNHCVLVAPIVAVLVWLRRRELCRLTPGLWATPLGWVAAAAALWLLGELAGVGQARHLALIGMVQGAAAVCLGRQVTRGLLFPLGFLLFLVPFGAELVPPLQQATATMATGLLHLSGIPARLNGVFLTTPAGWFEVAEACSGIAFLIATVAWGALVANLLFRSWGRRVAMIAACVALPVVANGLRAWATIAAAELVGVERASGFDHIVYGWIFFAFVLSLLFAGAWRFFERDYDEPAFDADRLARVSPGAATPGVVPASLALPLMAYGWAALASGVGDRPMPNPVALPDVPGWTVVAEPINWEPHYAGADHRLLGRYRDARWRSVDLAVALFRTQGEGHEVVGYGQGAIPSGGPWSWSGDAPAADGARGERLVAADGSTRTAWTWGVVSGVASGSVVRLKLATLSTRMRLGDPSAGAVVLSTAGEATALAEFARALGPPETLVARLVADARGR